jgi:hypothetical protein
VRYRRGRRDVDGEHIGLFGLSQGTWLIGMAAEQTPVGFLVFASGSGIPVWEQDLYRTSAMMREDGFSEAEIAESDAYQRLKFRVARTGLDWQQLKARTEELKARPARWFDDYAGEFASLASARFWWLAAFRYDPTPGCAPTSRGQATATPPSSSSLAPSTRSCSLSSTSDAPCGEWCHRSS